MAEQTKVAKLTPDQVIEIVAKDIRAGGKIAYEMI